MYYIYILYSEFSDLYYVGFTDNINRRLEEHNTKPSNTFTSKHRPWKIKTAFQCNCNLNEVMHLEKFIKKQKSKKFIEMICEPNFTPTGRLANLVRVPNLRD